MVFLICITDAESSILASNISSIPPKFLLRILENLESIMTTFSNRHHYTLFIRISSNEYLGLESLKFKNILCIFQGSSFIKILSFCVLEL